MPSTIERNLDMRLMRVEAMLTIIVRDVLHELSVDRDADRVDRLVGELVELTEEIENEMAARGLTLRDPEAVA